MNENKKLSVWLPLIIALSVSLGIFIGNHYIKVSNGRTRITTGNNKINAVLEIIKEQYVDTVDMPKLIEGTIPKIFSELDPHSVYISAEDATAVLEDMEGTFSGIGVSFNMQTDTILVISVIPGGPSEKAGLLPFDRIITINDSVYAGKEIRDTHVMKLLRGEKNSTVRLGVKRGQANELIEFEVTRGDVPVHSVDVAYAIREGIGYIKVNKFSRTTYNEFITAIAKLNQQGCSAYIIDLRNNGGGMMDAAINMINEFLPAGQLIVYTEGKSFPQSDVYSNGTGTCKEAPLVVLTDEISASASEIFAGAIQDNDRGIIIGRRTYGKGLVQNQIGLNDGSQLRLTIARYYTPSGRSIQKEYKLGKGEDYDMDIYNRFMHGEFDSADSIKLDDLPRYKTTIGRTVYGGGGIMPDIFIPRDTSGITSYYSSVINTGVLYQFALEYSDRHKKQFAAYRNYRDLYDYLTQQPILEEFTDYAVTKGVRKRPALIAISGPLITNQIHAYIIRNFFDEEGFYPIFQQDDPVILKAVEVIRNGESFPVPDEYPDTTTENVAENKGGATKRYSYIKETPHARYTV